MLVKEIQAAVREVLDEMVQDRAFASYQGHYSTQLNEQLANTLSSANCALFSSGSSAMEAVLRASGVGPGDKVLLSGYDYPGNFWAIERCGATPVLLDTEPQSWNLDASKLEAVLGKLENDGSGQGAAKALIVSHLHGQLQDVAGLKAILCDRSVALIEDSCQAIGAQVPSPTDSLKPRPVGELSDALVVSFGGGKVLSAGRGGALLTRSDALAQKAKLAAGAGSGPYAMSELQAATVLAQLPFLKRIDATARQFFTEVQDDVRSFSHFSPSQPLIESPVDLSARESQTSIYQMGWIRQSKESASDEVEPLPIPGFKVELDGFSGGSGFSGFHRRSKRRCLTPIPLQQVPLLARDTIVVHHGVALEGRTSPQEVAESIFAILKGN
ncbi:MAG: DegT/DnrJ/EryC1/StrS family aminotransferase [Planctomycetota bacterium]|nr:DegT/DnrJ/EryC1/StrS family aminotransferase [Planctomycetota bacterium]